MTFSITVPLGAIATADADADDVTAAGRYDDRRLVHGGHEVCLTLLCLCQLPDCDCWTEHLKVTGHH